MCKKIGLKPCWNCEELEHLVVTHVLGEMQVECLCGVRGPLESSLEACYVAWNTHPSPWITINGDKTNLPETDEQVLCVLQHWYTKGKKTAVLFKVDEDDVDWRTADNNSEISYDWNVIAYMPIPELPGE